VIQVQLQISEREGVIDQDFCNGKKHASYIAGPSSSAEKCTLVASRLRSRD